MRRVERPIHWGIAALAWTALAVTPATAAPIEIGVRFKIHWSLKQYESAVRKAVDVWDRKVEGLRLRPWKSGVGYQAKITVTLRPGRDDHCETPPLQCHMGATPAGDDLRQTSSVSVYINTAQIDLKRPIRDIGRDMWKLVQYTACHELGHTFGLDYDDAPRTYATCQNSALENHGPLRLGPDEIDARRVNANAQYFRLRQVSSSDNASDPDWCNLPISDPIDPTPVPAPGVVIESFGGIDYRRVGTDRVYISGADGGPVAVDDELQIDVLRDGGTWQSRTIDFSNACSAVTPQPSIDITDLLPSQGWYLIRLTLKDRCGVVAGTPTGIAIRGGSCGAAATGKKCTARCCGGAVVGTANALTQGQCDQQGQTACLIQGKTLHHVRFDGKDPPRSAWHPCPQECCGLCRNRTAYHQVTQADGGWVFQDCTDHARAWCAVGDRGELKDAAWLEPRNDGTDQCKVPPVCGNRIPESGEACDGGGCEAGKYCTSACTCQPVSPFPEGTFTRTPSGAVYRTAGHSPVYLTTCQRSGYFSGCPASFWNAPQDFVDALIRVYPVPVDGALVRRPDGAVFQMRSGRAQYVQSCAGVGGCGGLVDLDWAAVDRLGGVSVCCAGGCGAAAYCTSACTCQPVSPFPEGKFTRTPSGAVYRTAGRSPVYISTCAASGYYPGCPASFWSAPQDFVDGLTKVYPVPIDGSLVRRPDGAVFQMRCGRAEYVQSCGDVGGCGGLIDLDWAAVDRLGGGIGCGGR